MEQILALFLTWQFGLMIAVNISLTYVARVIIEYTWLNNPKIPTGERHERFFNKLFLRLFPVALGVAAGLIGEGMPDAANTPFLKSLFGISAGFLAPILFPVLKTFFWGFIPAQYQSIVSNLGSRSNNESDSGININFNSTVVNNDVPCDPVATSSEQSTEPAKEDPTS